MDRLTNACPRMLVGEVRRRVGSGVVVVLVLAGCSWGGTAPGSGLLRVAVAPCTSTVGSLSGLGPVLQDALAVSLTATGLFEVVRAQELTESIAAAVAWFSYLGDQQTYAASKAGADAVLRVELSTVETGMVAVDAVLHDVISGRALSRSRCLLPSGTGSEVDAWLAATLSRCARDITSSFAQGAGFTGAVGTVGADGSILLSFGTETGLQQGAVLYLFRKRRVSGEVQVTETAQGYSRARILFLRDAASLRPTDKAGYYFNPSAEPLDRLAPSEQDAGIGPSKKRKTLQTLVAVASLAGLYYLVSDDGGSPATSSQPVIPGTTGTIVVASAPPGAAVLLDGVSTNHVTPFTLDAVAAGAHTVTLVKSGYQTATVAVAVAAGQTAAVNATLTPAAPPGTLTTGSLSVNSSPVGAAIFLDGTATGQLTPATLALVFAGAHSVMLRKSGYAEVTASVTVVSGQTTAVNEVLTPVAPPQGP